MAFLLSNHLMMLFSVPKLPWLTLVLTLPSATESLRILLELSTLTSALAATLLTGSKKRFAHPSPLVNIRRSTFWILVMPPSACTMKILLYALELIALFPIPFPLPVHLPPTLLQVYLATKTLPSLPSFGTLLTNAAMNMSIGTRIIALPLPKMPKQLDPTSIMLTGFFPSVSKTAQRLLVPLAVGSATDGTPCIMMKILAAISSTGLRGKTACIPVNFVLY